MRLRRCWKRSFRRVIVFTSQSVLEDRYACYGHFYELDTGINKYTCRSVLEIIRVDEETDSPDDLTNLRPDAVVVMMNPGSSRPAHPNSHRIMAADMGSMVPRLALTCPDTTQYQIMRVMDAKTWNHVRVLNLSDLRDAKSISFYSLYDDIKKDPESSSHSVFASERQAELFRQIGGVMTCIAAWGVSNRLDTLITSCTGVLRNTNMRLVGVAKAGCNDRYYHPLQQGNPMTQEEWLFKIIGVLDS